MIESDIKAKLSFSDGTPDIDLPIYKGSVGPDVIDIRKLYGIKLTNINYVRTYRPFVNW